MPSSLVGLFRCGVRLENLGKSSYVLVTFVIMDKRYVSEDPRKHLKAFSALELSVDASKNHVFLFTNTNININIKTKTNTQTLTIFSFFRRSRPPSMSLQTLFLTQSGVPSNEEYSFMYL